MDENLNPIEKLDKFLTYFMEMGLTEDGRTSRLSNEIHQETGSGDVKEMFEILHKLQSDGYISSIRRDYHGKSVAFYSSTFDGRLFYLNGGYDAKSFADAANAEEQRLEIARLRNVNVSNDQNQKTLNTLTNRLAWATWFAFGAAISLLCWQIFSYYHPAAIPVNVKLQTEQKH